MSLNPCSVRSARPADVSLGDNHVSGKPRSLSVTARHYLAETAHFEQFC